MSATCQGLPKRSAEQGQLGRAAADDAAKILQIATILAAGADDSVRRNSAVAGGAQRDKKGLGPSTPPPPKLVEEKERGAAGAPAPARAPPGHSKCGAPAHAGPTPAETHAL